MNEKERVTAFNFEELHTRLEALIKETEAVVSVKEVERSVADSILRKSAYSLPDRPSEAGMTPLQIKQAFYRPLIDAEKSLLAEINRVVSEVNAVSPTNELSRLCAEVITLAEVFESLRKYELELEEELRDAVEECVKTSEKTSGAYIYRILDGQNGVVGYSGQVQEHSIAQRTFGGRLRVGEPQEDSDAVTKKYADGALSGLDVRTEEKLAALKSYTDETKVGKVGDQVIEGGLSISGDLLVGGDTFAKQIESLEVGDAVIIANADGVLLSELSGYVIRVNGDSAYAIVYDPADDCVKIGLGTYNSETKLFVFGEGEAQVLATRGAIADGHIPVWNDVKKIFEDSGKSINEIGDSSVCVIDVIGEFAEEYHELISPEELYDDDIVYKRISGMLLGRGGIGIIQYADNAEIRLLIKSTDEGIYKLVNGDIWVEQFEKFCRYTHLRVELSEKNYLQLTERASMQENGEYEISDGMLVELIPRVTQEEFTGLRVYTDKEVSEAVKRVEKLEYAAKGILYKDKINEGIAKSVTITDDVLPYGVISMVGGASYIKLRNLVPYPYSFTSPSYTSNGVTRTLHPDGSFSVKGTCTKDFRMWLFMKSYGWNPGKHKFSLSGCPAGGADDKYYLQIALFETADATVPLLQVRDYGDGVIFDARYLDYECMTLLFVVKSGASVDCTVRPQLDNGVVTDWEPYTIKHTPVKRVVRTKRLPYEFGLSDGDMAYFEPINRKLSLTTRYQNYGMTESFEISGFEKGVYTMFIKLTNDGMGQYVIPEKSCIEVTDTRETREIYFDKVSEDGVIKVDLITNGSVGIKISVDLSMRASSEDFVSFLVDIVEGDVPISECKFGREVYEIPDKLMKNCQDYGHGVGYSDSGDECWFNYIDFENGLYCQNVMVCDIDEYVELLSDGTNYLATNYWYDKVIDISQYINEDDFIIPLAKGDVISFETEDGEVPMPVPYAIKYQVKV